MAIKPIAKEVDDTITKAEILLSQNRIKNHLKRTQVVSSTDLNNKTGHKIYFKLENLQHTGAFKVRGALNHLLALQEQNELPSKISAYTTGNHGLGVCYACNLLGLSSKIYMPSYTSKFKQKILTNQGADVVFTDSRAEAEFMAENDRKNGFYFLHPSNHNLTIAGAATMALESIEDINEKIDAIFASCGGGGLLAGTYLAKEYFSQNTKVIGSEPENANDAIRTLSENEIYRFTQSPDTVADALKALSISQKTHKYLKKVDYINAVNEEKILHWCFWLSNLLNITCEPSSALNMQTAIEWLKDKNTQQTIVILISGGNVTPELLGKLAKLEISEEFLIGN